jgi:hypothetical protein
MSDTFKQLAEYELETARLRRALTIAQETLELYADPSGYTDSFEDPYSADDPHHPGKAAEAALGEIRSIIQPLDGNNLRVAIIEECAAAADEVERQQDIDLGDANSGGAAAAARAIRALSLPAPLTARRG